MDFPSDTLSVDLDALRALLLAERASHAAERERLTLAEAEIAWLRQIIQALQRHRFGRRSERLDPDQLALALEDLEQAVAATDAASDGPAPTGDKPVVPPAADRKRREAGQRRINRGALPAHLPRIERIVDIDDKTCPCCSGLLHKIGEDRSERLDVVPAQLRVEVTIRPKYACRACTDGVTQAPAPARLIEGGLPTEALLAHVIVAKYADHCPLYRQAQIYARQGVDLDRSTLADWVGRAAWYLKPLRDRLLDHLKSSSKLYADETTAPVLDPGRGRTKTGKFWTYARDDRPWNGPSPPAVVYIYAPDRKAERPQAHLDGFTGILQVDGYSGYRPLAATGQVQLAFCWSHVRRRFYEIAKTGSAPIATEALARISQLYAVEAGIRGQTAEARRAARQHTSRPLIDSLRPWLEQQGARVSQKSAIAEAIRYALTRWDGLSLFLDDGRIELDSNAVERAIRPITLNRKNALFAGSDAGGENWGVIASLIETAKLNAVDPQAYLTEILTRLANGQLATRLDELLPWKFSQIQKQAKVA
jgi:transposase